MMNVYVPSRSRFTRSLTLEAIQGHWPGTHTFLVVPKGQAAQYKPLAAKHGVTLLPCAANGIARTRQFIGQHADDKFLMLDDDLRFFVRPQHLSISDDETEPNTKAKLFKFDALVNGRPLLVNGMQMMLQVVENKLERYAHVAISAREGNNHLAWPYTENNRPLRALAYRKKPFLACEHGRVEIMEDFDVTLQLMKKGHANCIITWFAQDQIQTQAAGGCSDYRTHALHEENVRRMVKLHAPFVIERLKENKGGGDFGTRTEATIYWKKAWQSAQDEWT